MNGFNYTDIFETKGIEYIAIIAFFILLIPFWIILNHRNAIRQKIQKAFNMLSFDILKIPQGVFYSKNHTWAYLEKAGTAAVGLDDFLLHTTGVVQLTNLKNSGETIQKGELLTELVKDHKILKIFSPISGEITKTNTQLKDSPEILNNDPYDNGWIYKIKPTKWMDETQRLYLAEDAINWSKTEMQRFKDFLALTNKKYVTESSFAILQDGGELVDHTLSGLSNDVWQDFQTDFLNNQD